MILLLVLMQLSCERDEICLEDITPKLIIRFYNENNPNEFKSVPLLKVNIEGIGCFIDVELNIACVKVDYYHLNMAV